ncbi:hypothetical protein CJ195_21760 [Bacillus sp. UMB0899]|uniref:hypothetical protein n=1 Tax=Metabacillus schmidteae TaxID=2730405 RepID=UPI000C806BAB|nr:hypothetical protein [Metabacillus schmidteae]PMC34874.1 hypothetical protein CJ195_21760 [Bacillus sp. UMB0899]
MIGTLNDDLFKSYKYMKNLLRHFSFSQHPHDLYISSLLREVVSLTRSTIMIVQQEVVAKRRLRHVLAILSRSYVAFANAFHEWKMSAKLRDPANIQLILQREQTAKLIDKHLKLSIPEIEKMFSKEVLRGIVRNRR